MKCLLVIAFYRFRIGRHDLHDELRHSFYKTYILVAIKHGLDQTSIHIRRIFDKMAGYIAHMQQKWDELQDFGMNCTVQG